MAIQKDVSHLLPVPRLEYLDRLEEYGFLPDQRSFAGPGKENDESLAQADFMGPVPETKFADVKPRPLDLPLADGAIRREYFSRDLEELLDTGCLLSTTVALDVGPGGALMSATAYFSQQSVLCY